MTDPAPTPTPTPEPETFSKDYVQSLRAESGNYRTQLRKAETDLAAAIAERDGLATQLTEAQAASGSSTSLVEAAEAKALRYEVALDKGLAPALARRLAGSTREELEADASELMKLAGHTPPEPIPGHGVGDPPKTAGLSPIQAALAASRGAAN